MAPPGADAGEGALVLSGGACSDLLLLLKRLPAEPKARFALVKIRLLRAPDAGPSAAGAVGKTSYSF